MSAEKVHLLLRRHFGHEGGGKLRRKSRVVAFLRGYLAHSRLVEDGERV